MANIKTDPVFEALQLKINTDNEALILSNAIQDSENREIFVRKVDYLEFRELGFRPIAWAVSQVVSKKMEMNHDAILLLSKTCPSNNTEIKYEDLVALTSNYPVVPKENFEQHIETLKLDNVKQSLIKSSLNYLVKDCRDPKVSLSKISQNIDYLKRTVESGYTSTKLEFKSMDQVVEEYKIAKSRIVEKRTCGFKILDEKLTEGLKGGQISVIAGLSSMGKSSWALSMMNNLSNKGVYTAQFALEMDNMSITSKLLAFNADKPLSTIVKNINEFSESDRRVIEWEMERLGNNKYIFLNDKPSQSLSDIREQIMMLQDKLKTEYIVTVIDLFGKIRDFQTSDNFARDYEKKLNQVQAMTRELGVHMSLVAQINRTVAKRSYGRPKMSDLKNAGALEEVADIIFGIHRPYYDPEVALKHKMSQEDDTAVDKFSDENLAEVIILKNRMGENNTIINFIFDPLTTRFSAVKAEDQNMININKPEFFDDED
jgi:replicative DNA helicase